MRIYQRGTIWWTDFTALGHRYRLSTGQTTKRLAQATAEGWLLQAKLGQWPSLDDQANQGPLTLGDAFGLWYDAQIAGRRSQEEYRRAIKTVLSVLPETVPLNTVTPSIISQVITLVATQPITHYGRVKLKKPKGRSASTVNRLVIDHSLRPMLAWIAHTQGILDLPTIKWQFLRMKEPPGRAPRFTQAQLDKARAALPEWHRPIFDFFLRYGPRLKEAWFPLDAYDPKTCTWTKPAGSRKTAEPLTIKLMAADAAAMTARWSRAQQASLSHVWFKEGRRSIEPIKPDAFSRALAKAWRAAGLSDVRPVHDLRHHAASEFTRLRGDLAATKRLLGHASILSTQRYAHHSTDSLFDAMTEAYDEKRGTIAAQSARRKKKT